MYINTINSQLFKIRILYIIIIICRFIILYLQERRISMFGSRIINLILFVISVVAAIFIANIFSCGYIPFIRSVIKILLILASLIIAAYVGTLTLSYFTKNPKIKMCLKSPGILTLVASMGSIVTSTMVMGTAISPTSTPIVILIGFGGFFATLMVLTFTYLIICIAKRFWLLPDIT